MRLVRLYAAALSFNGALTLSPSPLLAVSPSLLRLPFFFSLFTEYKFTFGNRGEARTLHSSEHRYTFFCRWSRTDEQA